MVVESVSRNKPLISVVMSFRNARDTLSRSIRSILWQTYPHWEMILLDDGSSDGSADIAKSIEDSRIRFYSDTVCRSLPFRLNQGVSLATGQYIARMDADDVSFPERFEKQVAFLQEHPEIDLLATSALLVDKDNQALGVLAAGLSHAEICRRPWHGFPMPHPTWMGRADWYRQNPYNELASKAQDQSLLYHTFKTSRFAGLPDVLLGYRYAGLSLRKTMVGRYNFLRAVAKEGNRDHLFKGVFGHTLAGMRDLTGMVFRMDSRVIKARVQHANTHLLADWNALQTQMSDPVDPIDG